MDTELQEYREYLIEKHNAEFPEFAKDAVHTAPVLALLRDPGNSGAEDSRVCSIDYNDQTSRNQRMAIDSSGINTADIVFWNFYAPFGIGNNFGIESQKKWAEEIEKLIGLMPNLKVVLACGKVAQKGMKSVKLDKDITLIEPPHPSWRGQSRSGNEEKLKIAWKQAGEIIK